MAKPVQFFVGPIFNKVVDILTNLLKEEFLLVYNVKNAIENLKRNLTTLQDQIKQAEREKLEDTNMKSWVLKVKHAAYDADDIIDTFATEAFLWKRKPHRGPHHKLLRKSEIAKKVRDISQEIENIVNEKRLYLPINSGAGDERYWYQDNADATTNVNTTNVIGREADRDKLVDLLLSGEQSEEGRVCVISILGMGGLGKSTLARYVFDDPRVTEHFTPLMWAKVTAQYDLLKILKDMIQSHSKMEYGDSLSQEVLEGRLKEILPGNRFLLVLDDVWLRNFPIWNSLEALLKLGDKGSRVLVTSRLNDQTRAMGIKKTFSLGYMPDDKCLSLFKQIAFLDPCMQQDFQTELETIGKQIVGKCQGLPLAVVSLAGLLRVGAEDVKYRQNIVKRWQHILDSTMTELENKEQNPDPTPNILPILKVSYNHLHDLHKPCFSYCSIFPKGHVFIKEELVKLWIAQGYFFPTRRQSADAMGIECFEYLVRRFFFEIAETEKNERYRMHDLIHDLAQSISINHCCQVKDFKPTDRPQDLGCTLDTRHVSLLDQDIEQPALMIADVSKKTRTLLLPTVQTKRLGAALTTIFTSLNYLRTLDLSSSILLELPSAIEDLKLLRYLDLSRTEIKLLPNSICNLYNLQVLKLLGCIWLYQLPADFNSLVNLCHLELDELFWFKCRVLPANIGNLINLRNWHAFHVDRKKGYGIEELEKLEYLVGTLRITKLENAVNAANAKLSKKQHIQKLMLEWTDAEAFEEGVLEDLQPHGNLQELQICGYGGNQMPTWMASDLLQNMVTLSLTHCSKTKTLTLGGLPRLRELNIKGMNMLEELSEGQFLSLQRLKLSNCPRLLNLPQVFPNLRVLKIKKCEALKALPVTPSLMFLILLDNLALEDWKETTVAITYQNDEGQQIHENLPSFVKLIELKVENCPNLSDMPIMFAPQKLEIRHCDRVRCLPRQELSGRLQHLALEGCNDDTLVRAIPESNTLYSLVLSKISNLATIPRWPQLPGLKALYINDCQDLSSLPEGESEGSLRSLTSLKFFSLRGCGKLVTLPDDGLPTGLECLRIASCTALETLGNRQTLTKLASLRDLYIEECPRIESFPEDGLPTNLKHLVVEGCPKLTDRCKIDGPEWPKIEQVPDLEIDCVRVAPATETASSSSHAPSNHVKKLRRKWLPFFCSH